MTNTAAPTDQEIASSMRSSTWVTATRCAWCSLMASIRTAPRRTLAAARVRRGAVRILAISEHHAHLVAVTHVELLIEEAISWSVGAAVFVMPPHIEALAILHWAGEPGVEEAARLIHAA